MLLTKCLRIVGKVEHQRAHQRRALERDFSRVTIDIRKQFIPSLQVRSDDPLSLGPIVPGLSIAHVAVDAHQGQIDADLDPAQHALDVGLVVVLIARTEESACIVGPPGDACSLHAQAGHDLPTQGLPVVAYIAAPHGRPIALDAREAAAGEDHRPTARSITPQAFVHYAPARLPICRCSHGVLPGRRSQAQ